MQQAMLGAKCMSNLNPTIAPISILPSDLLYRIFYLVTTAQPCAKTAINNPKDSPRLIYPDVLAMVCSQWRQVVLESHALWSHIDFDLSSTKRRLRASTRAEALATRTGQMPLDIHITALPQPQGNDLCGYTALAQFIGSIASRIKSFDLGSWGEGKFGDIHRSLLSAYFTNAAPGRLTRLSLLGGHENSSPLPVDIWDNSTILEGQLFNLPQEDIEAILRHVTVLQLNGLGVYPHWTSQAYHGLVELSLLCPTSSSDIRMSRLMAVLVASPHLRNFRLGLNLIPDVYALAGPGGVAPVSLDKLEALELHINQPGIFDLITPSSKLTRLSLGNLLLDTSTLLGLKGPFFTHSNITKLRVDMHQQPYLLSNPHSLFPHLRILALRGFHYKETIALTFDSDSHGDLSTTPPLDALYIQSSFVEVDKVMQTTKRCLTQALVFWDCLFINDVNLKQEIIDTQELEMHLVSHVCPVVKILPRNDPDPTKDWW